MTSFFAQYCTWLGVPAGPYCWSLLGAFIGAILIPYAAESHRYPPELPMIFALIPFALVSIYSKGTFTERLSKIYVSCLGNFVPVFLGAFIGMVTHTYLS